MRILILVVSADFAPYDRMIETSLNTWDSIDVHGVETVFYCGESLKADTDKIVYLPVRDSLQSMGYKDILIFKWALQNKQFDYVVRVNSSCYVDKFELVEYIKTLPTENLFACAEVVGGGRKWAWGGYQFIMSRDVVEKIIENKDKWDHSVMEDMAMSGLVADIGIPYTPIKACSINRYGEGWLLISSDNNNIAFNDFNELSLCGQAMYRVKQDGKRSEDKTIMEELFRCLN